MRKELEATFKEDISIYFDENPHDGLKETYQVQDSLKDKIRCVIFIPILSQTYCDPQSFAWKHELMSFCEFTKSSGEDAKVNVGLSNYMSRILPIRIHSLDPEDIQLFESQTGSTLRSIDFIYESGGVTRPLRAKDDDLTKGRSGILYRDQITKVSQSIKAIINAYKHRGSQPLEVNSSQPARSQRVRPVLYAIPAIIILFFAAVLFHSFLPFDRKAWSESKSCNFAI